MHELSAVQNILRIVLDEAAKVQAKRITRVALKLGRWSTFVPEHIKFYFDILAKGSLAEGADLDIEVSPVLFICQNCKYTYEPCLDYLSFRDMSTEGMKSCNADEYIDNLDGDASTEAKEPVDNDKYPPHNGFVCPNCKGVGMLTSGLECYVESIEVENADSGGAKSS
jgi:hydrogenase nickel incorporation protein HypA/HybF